MKWLFVIVALLAASPLFAQNSAGELGGYAEYLVGHSETSGQPSDLHLLHLRLNGKWYPTEALTGVLELRTRLYAGSTVERTPGFADQLRTDAGLGGLGAYIWKSPRSVGYAEIDRVFLNWNPMNLQVTVGRQRIAWGTNLVWNPIDLFNPLSVLDFDYAERPAADAVRLQYYTSEVSKLELAMKPGSTTSRAITAIQWTTNRWQYDVHVLGGWQAHGWFAGTAWAGDILGAGFRGEVIVKRQPGPSSSISTSPISTSVLSTSSCLSFDYTFPSSFYLHTEALYNSNGATSDIGGFRLAARGLDLLSPARWSLYQEFSYNIDPLVRASLFGLIDPIDGSVVMVPSATCSVVTNLDVMLLAMVFAGRGGTEFGGLGTGAYARVRVAF